MNAFLHGVAARRRRDVSTCRNRSSKSARIKWTSNATSPIWRSSSRQPVSSIDIRPGPGVDLVANVEELPHLDVPSAQWLALTPSSMCDTFGAGFARFVASCVRTGACWLSMAFHFQIHHFPAILAFHTAGAGSAARRYPSRSLVGTVPRIARERLALAFGEEASAN